MAVFLLSYNKFESQNLWHAGRKHVFTKFRFFSLKLRDHYRDLLVHVDWKLL
jgi:hypothetical protein